MGLRQGGKNVRHLSEFWILSAYLATDRCGGRRAAISNNLHSSQPTIILQEMQIEPVRPFKTTKGISTPLRERRAWQLQIFFVRFLTNSKRFAPKFQLLARVPRQPK